VTAESLTQASALLGEARRHHFLRDWSQSTACLAQAADCLRQAIADARRHPASRQQLRQALSSFQRELHIAQTSQNHAEGWLRQWLQAIQTATGDNTGYDQNGGLPFSATPRRIAVEG